VSDRIRTIAALLVILLSVGIVVGVLAADAGGDSNRVESLAERLKCPVCTSESVADSPAQVSRDLYDLIVERVADGWTDDEIIDFFVATYGEEALLDPKAGGTTAVLWIAPVLVLALGAFVIAGRFAADGREISDAERRNITSALEEH
jgi:cytochrome c-type biogenesis protein CcmH